MRHLILLGASTAVFIAVSTVDHRVPPIRSATLGAAERASQSQAAVIEAPPPDLAEVAEVKVARLSSELTELDMLLRVNGAAAATEFATLRALRMVGDRVRVAIRVRAVDRESVVAELHRIGISVEVATDVEIQALVPLIDLRAVPEIPGVLQVTKPLHPVSMATTSQGTAVIGLGPWKQAGITGAGVKVAVLDLGFSGYTSLLGTELPATVVTQSFSGDIYGGGENHGTAVAEIVHDIAPAAQMYLVNFSTSAEMSLAVDWLIAQRVDVINASFGFGCSSPLDGTGAVLEPVARARAAGIVWVGAAGNHAERHWAGRFSDPDGDGWHNFSGSDIGNSMVLDGDGIVVCAQWDDWTVRSEDFDLYLVDQARNTVVASSTNPQTGTEEPTERLSYSGSGSYYIAIKRKKAARDVNLKLYLLNDRPPCALQSALARDRTKIASLLR